MRSSGIWSRLALLAAAALLVTACSTSGASPNASGSALKIGLVTDVGTLNDKNFNEYSWLGAQDGATRIGAPAPKPTVTMMSNF
jgi:basic membrane lipoprotein Med (substrate-binding protein (PBP1-ABC) superfamily)